MRMIQARLFTLFWVLSASAAPDIFSDWSSGEPNRTAYSRDLFSDANDLGGKASTYAEKVVADAAVEIENLAGKVTEFKTAVSGFVSQAEYLYNDLHTAAEKHGVNREQLAEMIADKLAGVLEELDDEFTEPLPEEQTARYKHRAMVISRALSKIEDVFVNLGGLWGMSEDDGRIGFRMLQPHLEHVLLIAGNLIDNHPIVFEVISALVSSLIIEAVVAPAILAVFGFGRLGPVKGSVAAAVQRFWGPAVKEGSLFAKLQAAGMKARL